MLSLFAFITLALKCNATFLLMKWPYLCNWQYNELFVISSAKHYNRYGVLSAAMDTVVKLELLLYPTDRKLTKQ